MCKTGIVIAVNCFFLSLPLCFFKVFYALWPLISSFTSVPLVFLEATPDFSQIPKGTELPTRHHMLFSLPGTSSKPPSPLLPCLNPGVISLEKSFSKLLHSCVVWVPLLCALISFSLNFLIAILYIVFYKCLFTHRLLLPLDHPLSICCKCHADVDYWPWSSC